ncbi:AAA family ATPase [Mesorhizobium sp. L103C131B0]|uniref:AAA family ATPase n=1 Tax=Mesorhizobium sp. L103C131B0 TaxID=1287089 RepID=UPI0003CFC44B|nr:AAA family ATPase [Mesorhizobium sp. L103C131B0]ESZ54412.1 hypothetical protein X729_28510 [Mesorhizobium sp. L103C131B0]
MTEELVVFRSLKSFSGAGVWQDHRDAKGEHQFAVKNLIYGFNGTGKTTLSRAFASIQRGYLEDGLPSTTSFEFTLSDGTALSSKSLSNPFGQRLLVFNQDFIERNFKWDDSVAEPIFYLSEQSIDKKAEYDAAISAFQAAQADSDAAKLAEGGATKSLADFKTRVAKRVRELAPSQRYSQSFDARKIEPSYLAKDYSAVPLLNQQGLNSRQALLASGEANPPLSELPAISPDLAGWWSRQFVLLSSTPGSQLAEEFQIHSPALTWVSEGLHYHDQNRLTNCLLCGNLLTDERKRFLAQNFDSRWSDFVKNAQTERAQCSAYTEQLRELFQGVPKAIELQASLLAEGEGTQPKLKDNIAEFGKLLNQMAKLLDAKGLEPASVPDFSGGLSSSSATEWVAKFDRLRGEWNDIISRHNHEHAEFSSRQERAFQDIRDHVLAEEHADWKTLSAGTTDASKNLVTTGRKLLDARQKRDALSDVMRTHGAGADKLNKLLKSYLGHGGISLRTSNEGYQLIRSGGTPATQLSEGEKAALAFCFYLTQFEAEGRKKKELIAVIDDPISSLDTSARTHAFSLMSRMTKDCRQAVVLTHNMSFMNMVKREFTKNGGPAQSLFQLECTCQMDDPDNRATRLRPMTNLIKDYDTEYHYLFEIVLKASRTGASEFHYLLPNATRKLLEMFTAFSAPDQKSFAGALGSSGVQLKENDPKALERLIQIESHGTMEGLSSLPALTVEEALRATKAAIEFIKRRDDKHFKAMCRVCLVPEET